MKNENLAQKVIEKSKFNPKTAKEYFNSSFITPTDYIMLKEIAFEALRKHAKEFIKTLKKINISDEDCKKYGLKKYEIQKWFKNKCDPCDISLFNLWRFLKKEGLTDVVLILKINNKKNTNSN